MSTPGGPSEGLPSFQPGPPEPGYGAAAPVARPKPIVQAVQLMYAGAVISLLQIFSIFLVKDDIRKNVIDNATKKGNTVDVDTVVNVAVASAVVAGLIGIALWVWMAKANGSGRTWARIVATVLAVINLLGFLINVAQGSAPGISLVLGILSLLVAAATLFLLWRPESSEFYEASSAPRL